MVQRGSLINYFFELILGMFLDFSLNTFYESLKFSETATQEDFEFVSYDVYSDITLEFRYALLPAEKSLISKKKCSKENLIVFFRSSHCKMIFAPLTKIEHFIWVLSLYISQNLAFRVFHKFFLE